MDPYRNIGKAGDSIRNLLQPPADIVSPRLSALQRLIEKFAPVICFHPEEEYFPVSVNSYLQKAWLVNGITKTKLLVTPAGLCEASERESRYYIELVEETLSYGDKAPGKAYVHAKARGANRLDLQYWFFYDVCGGALASVKWLIDGSITGYNGRINLSPLGKVSGVWERVTVRVNTATQEAEAVFFPGSGKGAWILADQLQQRGSQVLVYAAKHDLTFYPLAGSHHSEKIKCNLYSSQLEFAIQHDAAAGMELDLSTACELISAPYLGEDRPEEPLWLDFKCHWGNPDPDYLTVVTVKRLLQNTFGKTHEFLLSREIMDELIIYLLKHFINRSSRLLSPTARKCWSGEETD